MNAWQEKNIKKSSKVFFFFHFNIKANTTCIVKNAHLLNSLGTVRSQAGAEEKIVKKKNSKNKQNTYFQVFDILFFLFL